MEKKMTDCIMEAIQAVQESNFTGASSDNITSLACTLYINANKSMKSFNKGGSGGSYGGNSGGGSSNYNKPANQVMVVGTPCDSCGTPLKQS